MCIVSKTESNKNNTDTRVGNYAPKRAIHIKVKKYKNGGLGFYCCTTYSRKYGLYTSGFSLSFSVPEHVGEFRVKLDN